MLHAIVYSKNYDDVVNMKNSILDCCEDIECTVLSFEYPMDMLDYVNTARPKKCAVYYMTENYEEGLEIAGKVNEINPIYRFSLICSQYDTAENLFYNGVTYYVNTADFEKGMVRCTSVIKKFYEEKSGKAIQLKNRNGVENIMLADIDYIMSDKRRIIIKSKSHEKVYYYKLDELESMLESGFLRCHQSYIVNMSRIKQFVTDGVILKDDTFIPASRKRYYASKREYLSYITGNKSY